MSDAYRFVPRSGGCQCGAIRFHATQLCDNPNICYCRMCQKAVGNLLVTLAGVEHEHLTWTRGKPAEFMSSDQAGRGFCVACGTPLYYRSVGGSHVSICIGAFDDPKSIPLLYQFGIEGKHPSLAHLEAIEDMGTTEDEMGDSAAAIKAANHQHPDHDTADWPPKGDAP